MHVRYPQALKNNLEGAPKDLKLNFNYITPVGQIVPSINLTHLLPHLSYAQAMKNNPEGAPKDLKLNSNYITRFGQVALSDAVDMVFGSGKGKQVTVHF